MSFTKTRSLAGGTAIYLILSAGGGAWAQEAYPENRTANGTLVLDEIVVIDVGAGADKSAGTDLIVIDAKEIERKKPQDLRELFAGEPQIAVGGAIPSTQKIYVNGIDENNLAVTVDGSRQNNKVFHHNGTYLLDPALLKAASVQAGVAPADAGPGALAGSLGFETKDAVDLLEPGRDFGGFVTSTWDTNSETFIGGVSAFGRQGGFEYLGALSYGKGGNFTAGNGEEMLGTGTDLISGLGKLAYEGLDGDRFEISHERVRDDAPRPYRANVYINNGREPATRNYELNRQNTVFTYHKTSAVGWWDPKVVIAYSSTDLALDVTDRRSGLIGPAEGDTSSFNGKIENRFAVAWGSVTAGFDFYNDKAALDSRFPGMTEISDERATNVGAYAQARLEPFDRTRISFGGRADNQWFTGVDDTNWTNAGLSGNISGEYDLLPEFLTAKAGVSRVWGGVPLAENFIQNPTWRYDDPTPVRSNNYTAGLEANYNGLFLEANVFRTEIFDARFPSWGPPRGAAATPDNTSQRAYDVLSKGWEIGGGYRWDTGFVSVRYADVDSTVDGQPADSEIGRYMTTPIGQIIMIGAGHELPEWGLRYGGDMEIALKYDGSLTRHPGSPTDPKQALPGYEVVNAYAEWTPPSKPNFTLRADARNIFDETYTDRAAYGQDFLGVKPHYDPGRSFRLSATMRF